MSVDGTGGRSPAERFARGLLRHWAPYLLGSGTLFAGSAIVGAAVGSERDSPLLPVPAGTNPFAGLDAAGLFVHNGGVSLLLVLGALLFGLPTAYLLLLNGFLFGAGFVEFVSTYGAIEATAMLLPHAIFELPALVLAGAIAFRACHSGWRVASGTDRSTSGPLALLETVVAVVVLVLLLAIAALIEATASAAIAGALT